MRVLASAARTWFAAAIFGPPLLIGGIWLACKALVAWTWLLECLVSVVQG